MRMSKIRGFTLIEMLAVIAIIGILAALIIPVIVGAIQKAKQKGTMQGIIHIATGIADYVTDHGEAPVQAGGTMQPSFISALSGFYLKIVPQNDQWSTPFQVLCGSGSISGYDGVTNTGVDDFIIASWGRDKKQTSFTFVPLSPESVYFQIKRLDDFNKDLVNWNGSWAHAPRSAKLGSE